MAIFVTGGTGAIGSQVVTRLVQKGAEVYAFARSPEKVQFPRGVTSVKGDLRDLGAVQAAGPPLHAQAHFSC